MCADAMHASMSSSFVLKVSRYCSLSRGIWCHVHGAGQILNVASPFTVGVARECLVQPAQTL